MGRIIISVLLTLFFIDTLHSQQKQTFHEIDKTTYDLYLSGSWKELIDKGEEAVSQGTDYFYLRMRVGIAAYELKDYPRAIRHFRKALEFNSADDVAGEYLYFSLLFYGRKMEADLVARNLSPGLREKLSISGEPGVSSIFVNATMSFLREPEIIENSLSSVSPPVEGYQSATKNFRFWNGGFRHYAGNRLLVTHSAGYLSKTYMLLTREPAQTSFVADSELSQFQYYISGRILLGKGSYLIPALHYVNVRLPYETVTTGRGGRTFIMQQHEVLHDFAASLSSEKHWGRVTTGISAVYSDINEERQVQGNLSLSWFPLGNLNLYSVSDITWYSVLPELNEAGWIVTQKIGLSVSRGLWLEFWGSLGERQNFAGSGAMVIYNDGALIREQYGINLIAPFRSGLALSLNYGYTLHESRYITDSADNIFNSNPIEYNTHKITGGIKWDF